MNSDNSEKMKEIGKFLNFLNQEKERGTLDRVFEELKFIFLSSEITEEDDLLQFNKIANNLLFFIFFTNNGLKTQAIVNFVRTIMDKNLVSPLFKEMASQFCDSFLETIYGTKHTMEPSLNKKNELDKQLNLEEFYSVGGSEMLRNIGHSFLT